MIFTGEPCGDDVCDYGGECCMKCDEDGHRVPDKCGEKCAIIDCKPRVIVLPPIIVDPPSIEILI